MSGFVSTDVDYEVLNNVMASLVDHLHDELGNIYFAIRNDVMPGLGQYWQGAAMDTFARDHEQLVSDLWALFGGYSDLINALNTSWIEYRTADDFAKQSIAELPA